jgi:polysaccharide export outer membrane protein
MQEEMPTMEGLDLPGKSAARWLILSIVAICAGCAHSDPLRGSAFDMPRELAKVNLPPYVIEPPDILLIDAIRTIPKPPYKIEPLDGLFVEVAPLPVNETISGIYTVEPDGTIPLGFSYGSVPVVGLTLDQAREAIVKHMSQKAPAAKVTVMLAQSRALQLIRGEHLCRLDGTIALGTYGEVHVAGLTLKEAKGAIEAHLSNYLLNPEVSVDVGGYNSKVYYVIFDGGGFPFGEQVVRLPITGNETVLDAVSQLNGLPPFTTRHHIWIARPAPPEQGCDQVLPVDWQAITRRGAVATNYQLLPGDRIFVKVDPLIHFDSIVAKSIAPFERAFGFILLGDSIIRPLNTGHHVRDQ